MAKTESQESTVTDVSKYQVTGKAGDILFEEGEVSAEVYFLEEGRIELLRRGEGETSQVAVLESGDFFGEASMLDSTPREVTARALSAFTALRLDRETFIQVARENPEIPILMLGRATRRTPVYRQAEGRTVRSAAGPIEDARVQSPMAPAAGAEPVPPAPPSVSEAAPGSAAFFVHEASGTELPVPAGRTSTVGRPDRATGHTPDINLTPLDPNRTCGRRHAYVTCRDGEYHLLDETGMGNGSFINDVRVAKGVEAVLAHGDRVRFGLVELVFRRR
jgi:hypothetical protein